MEFRPLWDFLVIHDLYSPSLNINLCPVSFYLPFQVQNLDLQTFLSSLEQWEFVILACIHIMEV